MYPPRPPGDVDVLVTESTYGNRIHPRVDPEKQLGGRILQHVAAYGPDPKSAIILSGYPAPGTRGVALAAGARELHIYGEDVPIRAQVIQMENLSAHADAAGLIAWMNAADKEPRMTYITHGEPEASEALRVRIKRQLGWRARVPEHLDKISLEDPR